MVEKVVEALPVTEKHAMKAEAPAAPVDKMRAAPAPGDYVLRLMFVMGR